MHRCFLFTGVIAEALKFVYDKLLQFLDST